MSHRGRLAAGLLTIVFTVGGCAFASSAPVETPCGGSHVWPPSGYVPLPEGVIVERAGPTTIRVHNETGRDLALRTTLGTDSACVGFIADSVPRSLISTGQIVDTRLDPPDTTTDAKIGVEVYAADCDDACTEAPLGFGWIDVVVPTPS